ncbi:MAG: hypothetical protein M1817_003685 [Caeruleum heppii]|nr:MAG: hypothetical protein M1817_003685 [Caeruleum heppii]
MSGRYSYNPSDSHYSPRDRSPPNRRPSIYQNPSITSRAEDSRREALRDPPRGPKALVDTRPSGPGSSYAPLGPRGRGSYGRGDSRDREWDYRSSRDARDGPSYRGDRDRDRQWRDRELDRDRPGSPPLRGRSPPVRDFRDAREHPRELDVARARRSSRDGPLSAGSAASDPSGAGSLPFGRGGGSRGRGRGDWEHRGRGRGSHAEDRDRFNDRSLSRDRQRDRDRDRDRDLDRRDDRRVDPRQADREDREREAERYKRERLLGAADHRAPSDTNTTPSTLRSLSATSAHPTAPSRPTAEPAREPTEPRRASSSILSSMSKDSRLPAEKSDLLSSRAEATKDRYGPRTASPPPQPPQVPAFGSVPFKSASVSGPSSNVWRAGSPTKSTPQAPSGPSSQQAIRIAPTGPRGLGGINPPTAPKAERTGPVTARVMLPQSSPEKVRGPVPTNVPIKPALQAPPTAPQALLPSAEPSTPSPVKSRPTQIPTHPMAARPTSSSSPQPFPRGVGSTPRPPGSPASPNLGSNIPTGPKADRAGRGGPRSNQWIRGGLNYSPGSRPTSIYSAPIKRSFVGGDFDGQRMGGDVSNNDATSRDKTDGAAGQSDPQTGEARPSKGEVGDDAANRIKHEPDHRDVDMTEAPENRSPEPTHLADDPSAMKVDWHDEEDEDDMDMEETFEENMEKIDRDLARIAQTMEELKTQPLSDCDELAAIIPRLEDLPVGSLVPENGPDLIDTHMKSEAPGLPSPGGAMVLDEEDHVPDIEAYERKLTPPIESLPFLAEGPPTPVSELDVVNDCIEKHQKFQRRLTETIMQQRQDVIQWQQDLRQEWAAVYKPWREYVEELDAEAKKVEPPETVPDAPVKETVQPAPLPTPMEGRRGGKFSTELEFQLILKESELQAKEAQERADREAKAKVDVEKEAVIPDMLDFPDREAAVFQDRNHIKDAPSALQAFAFLPPQDDFTPEEQKVFIDNFVLFPKKWGKIAEALPGRDYQQCIMHYYLTKDEAKYKNKAKAKVRSRKGKRNGAGAQAKPKSNALMSDLGIRPELYDGDEFEAPSAPVTDSGRPRRAAAPVFGEANGDSENASSQAATPGRRPGATPRADGADENPFERTNKRTKTGATKEKGQRKGKSQLLAAAPTPSPQKVEKGRDKEVGGEKNDKREEEVRTKEMEDAQLLAGLQVRQVSMDAPMTVPDDQNGPPPPAGSPPRQGSRGSRPPAKGGTPSSYWSRPDTIDFPKLLDYFGMDWEGIASHMTSKTSVMVRNFYKREVANGKIEWKQRVEAAEARKARGEPRGPPPTPSILPKTRYFQPPPTAQRPLAPSIEAVEPEQASPGGSHGSVVAQSSPPQPAQAVRFPAIAQASSVPEHTTSQAPKAMVIQARGHDIAPAQQPADPPRAAPTLQGPRSGYFTDTRPEHRQIQQAQQSHQQQQQQQQQPYPPQSHHQQPHHAQQPQQPQQPKQHRQHQPSKTQHHVEPQRQQPQPQGQPQIRAQQAMSTQETRPWPSSASYVPPDSKSYVFVEPQGRSQAHAGQGPPPPSSAPTSAAARAQPGVGVSTDHARPTVMHQPASYPPPQQQPPPRDYQRETPHAPDWRDRHQYQASVNQAHGRSSHMAKSDAYGATPYQTSPAHTPAAVLSPSTGEDPRLTAKKASYPQQALKPRQAEPRKTSNIMDLLNSNEPEEPRPRKREGPTVTRQATSTPPHHGPAHYGPPPTQTATSAGRHESHGEPQPSAHGYQRTASGDYGYPPQVAPRSMHESMASGPSSAGSSGPGWYSRSYQAQVNSPQNQTSYLPPRTGHERLHANSPPPSLSHSRNTSYSDRPPSGMMQQQQQQQQQPHPQPPSRPSSTHQPPTVGPPYMPQATSRAPQPPTSNAHAHQRGPMAAHHGSLSGVPHQVSMEPSEMHGMRALAPQHPGAHQPSQSQQQPPLRPGYMAHPSTSGPLPPQHLGGQGQAQGPPPPGYATSQAQGVYHPGMGQPRRSYEAGSGSGNGNGNGTQRGGYERYERR